LSPRVSTFKVTQGLRIFRNRHGSIRRLWLSINVS